MIPTDDTKSDAFVENHPAGGAAPVLPPGRWVVDPALSSVSFVAKHLLVSKVRGTFTRVAGWIHVPEDHRGSSVHAMADAASLTTGDAARDDHLRSSDFFNVEQWPTLTLTGEGIRSKGGRHVLDATLTIRDVAHPVTFDVTATTLDAADPASRSNQGERRRTARFTADAVVNRKDFGLRWNAAIETGSVVVGDMVALTIVAVAELAH